MLRTPTPYPHVGSYALYVDPDLPVTQQRAELVRIQSQGFAPGSGLLISFPLRIGASGTKLVAQAALLDGTPLGQAERRELVDLQRALLGNPRGRKAKEDRAESLRQRAIWSLILESELAKLRSQQARQQPSIGGRLPLDAAVGGDAHHDERQVA